MENQSLFLLYPLFYKNMYFWDKVYKQKPAENEDRCLGKIVCILNTAL